MPDAMRRIGAIRLALAGLALATIVVGVALFVSGCGSGEEGPVVSIGSLGERSLTQRAGGASIEANHVAWGQDRTEPRVVAQPLDAQPRGSTILVGAILEECGGEEASLARIDVLKGESVVVVTAYVSYPPPYGPGYEGGCAELGIELTGEVDLGEPVGDRPIYDGMTWPPIQRWPPPRRR